MNVIDSNDVERDASGKPVPTFPHRAQVTWRALITAMIAIAMTQGAIFTSLEWPQRAEAQEGLETLAIITASGTHSFLVEVMRTEPDRQRGLMFRRYLPPDRGMLFDFESERPVAMWMKNTYIPLDMIFIGKSGKVVALAENTEPLSEKIIPSTVPAYSVLEINAGAAAKIGLKIGDSVRHFGKGPR